MEALEFRYEPLRYLASRVVYGAGRRFWSARVAPLHLVRLPRPDPPRPGWRRIDVRLSGICGSDLGMVTGSESLYLEPEATYPFVPGHELTGTIATESNPSGSGRVDLAKGQRVAVWSPLGCAARGVDPLCSACRIGWDGHCVNRDGGWPGSGIGTGFNHETGGGWAEACLAHESQLWPLPESVTDEEAVLLDAAASSLAALLRTDAPDMQRTLIVGGGTIGLLAAYLHAALRLPGSVESIVRHGFQAEWLARRGIAASIVRSERAFLDWTATRGMTTRRVFGYGHVVRGTFDRVIVAAATPQAVRQAFQAVRPRGTVALLTSPTVTRLDLTPLWYREVTVRGIYVYGPVPWQGEQRHPFAVLLPLLASGALAWGDLVTHSFRLSDYVAAFDAATHRLAAPALKVVFRPPGLDA